MASAPRDAIVADAVLAELVDGSWSQAFDSSRAYIVDATKSDTKRIVVFVQSAGSDVKRLTRITSLATHTILISVRRNVDPSNSASIDALSAFVQEIADYYQQGTGTHRITGITANVTQADIIPPDPDKLSSDREYFAGVQLTVNELVQA